jgi:hypothetical protein
MPTIINASQAEGTSYRSIGAKERRRYESRFGKMARVSRHDYSIIYCRELTSGGQNLAGLCEPNERHVYINIDYDPIEETLLHELFHAEFSESGLHQTNVWNHDLEELVVELLSKAMSHLFYIRKR